MKLAVFFSLILLSLAHAEPAPPGQSYGTPTWNSASWTPAGFEPPMNLGAHIYRNDATYAPDSGLDPQSLQHLMRTLSDWPIGEALSSQEQTISMDSYMAVIMSRATRKTGSRSDLEMTLNDVRGPDLQFERSAAQYYTATYGNLIDFPAANKLSYEIQIELPREIFLLSTAQAFFRLVQRYERDVETYERATQNAVWNTLARGEPQKRERPRIEDAKIDALLDKLSAQEETP